MNPVAQYDSSVDIHIPVRGSAYTCQQSCSFIGAHYYDGWFKDQVTAASGVSGPGAGARRTLEGSAGVSGGLGIYKGARVR